jgi:hypothetical protein
MRHILHTFEDKKARSALDAQALSTTQNTPLDKEGAPL